MLKVNIIVGTRPEIIRLSETIKLARKLFNVTLIHTGQNYDYQLNEVFFKELNIKDPDVYLKCDMTNLGTSVGSIIQKSYEYFKENKPDCILILGDTNSCLCSYSAKRLKIPIFHLESGNRCFDPNVPEEINRKIIDHLSDINMCYMEHARRNLLQEGISSKYTFVVGSPMTEILNKLNFEKSNILEKLSLEKNNYFVISTHREENIEKNFEKIVNNINEISKVFNSKIIFTVHPRTRKMINENKIEFNSNIVLSEPFGLIDYCKLQKYSKCVISDSGTVTEESTILKFPAVLLRTSTEHPEGIDSGNIIVGDINSNNLIRNINLAINCKFNTIINYKDGNFSQKVCNIISGYVSVVNKFIWMK
jgi:UDP-N-acetylglucosamine 2-epimerase (non-hydrolysing)